VDLVTTKRQEVEVDYCPHYCGVWLDRGELEKIIKRLLLVQRQDGDDDATRDVVSDRRSTDELFEFD